MPSPHTVPPMGAAGALARQLPGRFSRACSVSSKFALEQLENARCSRVNVKLT
jgi:hypothetical protein